MKVVPYDPKYKNEFIEMNKAWIADMFVIEEEDIRVLNNFEASLAKGGEIFFAIDEESEEVMACGLVEPLPGGEWELAKFCTKPKFGGRGAGSAVLKALLDYVDGLKVEKLEIVTNRKCVPAIHLYRKFGFVEVPVDKERFPFERADIAFERVREFGE